MVPCFLSLSPDQSHCFLSLIPDQSHCFLSLSPDQSQTNQLQIEKYVTDLIATALLISGILLIVKFMLNPDAKHYFRVVSSNMTMECIKD